MTKQKPRAGTDLRPILITIGIVLIPLTIAILYYIHKSYQRLIPLSVILIIAGAVIENKRVTQKWSTTFITALISYVLSFISFFPGKHEYHYALDVHISMWPYAFLFLYILNTVVFNSEKLIPRLSETTTLILSTGFMYWVFDHGYFNSSPLFIKILLMFCFLCAFFSIINAFTTIKLTKHVRLVLSIWSSLIMMVLAIENIYIVYHNGQVEDSLLLIDKIVIGLQYFLLGVCSMYITQNIMMIIMFMPTKNRFFNKEYSKDIKELVNEHLERYSDKQSGVTLSLLCFAISGAFYLINYKLDFLPRNSAIWIVFFILNNVVYFYEKAKTSYADV